jgi:pimeloyl-ACP methyl ester carboxylesterase
VEYRRLDCGGGVPQTVDDVNAAVAHLRAELHREPAAAVGHSAGGYLALLSDVPRIVGQAAVTDLREGIRLNLGDGVVERFAGPEPSPEHDPIRRAPLAAKVLLVHGTHDDTVPPEMSTRFAERGGDVQVSLREGEGHFEHVDPASGAWKEVVEWIAST